jgi:hypothetical protein
VRRRARDTSALLELVRTPHSDPLDAPPHTSHTLWRPKLRVPAHWKRPSQRTAMEGVKMRAAPPTLEGKEAARASSEAGPRVK